MNISDDKFIEYKNRFTGKIMEGTFKDAKYIIRIDGNIHEDAELTVREV